MKHGPIINIYTIKIKTFLFESVGKSERCVFDVQRGGYLLFVPAIYMTLKYGALASVGEFEKWIKK